MPKYIYVSDVFSMLRKLVSQGCELRVESFGDSFGKAVRLFTFLVGYPLYLTGQVFFVRSFCAGYIQFTGTYRQLADWYSYLLTGFFYPLSTIPMNTTNLIKD